jgi:hypothetical protein
MLRARVEAREWVGFDEMISDTPEGRAWAAFEKRHGVETASALRRLIGGRRDLTRRELDIIELIVRWNRAGHRCGVSRNPASSGRPRGRRARAARRARSPGRKSDADPHLAQASHSGGVL